MSTQPSARGARLLWSFDNEEAIQSWQGLHDQLMGGQSVGTVGFKPSGSASLFDPETTETQAYGVFSGEVSMANGGGFASVRAPLHEPVLVGAAQGVVVEACGFDRPFKLSLHLHPDADGVQHQVVFQAPHSWALVRLRLADFKPKRRGRAIAMSDVSASDHIHQLGLLTTERVAGGFMLGLRAIWLV
jgi:NADH dehydrogenase [ubiquinone] 1 alpha subcomplex assembly factor 1